MLVLMNWTCSTLLHTIKLLCMMVYFVFQAIKWVEHMMWGRNHKDCHTGHIAGCIATYICCCRGCGHSLAPATGRAIIPGAPLRSRILVKVKQFLYRPGHALSVPGGWSSQILRQSPHKGGKSVSSMHRPSLSLQETFLALISVSRYISPNATACTRRIMSVTPPGTEPSIFELVAQCLNQLHHVA
jgi:hypothetical protein